jgi:hypothetical protein
VVNFFGPQKGNKGVIKDTLTMMVMMLGYTIFFFFYGNRQVTNNLTKWQQGLLKMMLAVLKL